MAGSIHLSAHRTVVAAFTKARIDAGLLQAELGLRIGRDQSFISNIERGQRRIDVLEALVIAKALNLDPIDFYARLIESVPENISL